MLTNALFLANMYSNVNNIALLLLSSFICPSLLCLFFVIDKEFAVKYLIPITRITSQSSFGRPIPFSITSAQTVSSSQSSSVIERKWLHLLSIWSPPFIHRPFHSSPLHSQWSLSIPPSGSLYGISLSLFHLFISIHYIHPYHYSSTPFPHSFLFSSIWCHPHFRLFIDWGHSHSCKYPLRVKVIPEDATVPSIICLLLFLYFSLCNLFPLLFFCPCDPNWQSSSLLYKESFSALRPWEFLLIIWEGRKECHSSLTPMNDNEYSNQTKDSHQGIWVIP